MTEERIVVEDFSKFSWSTDESDPYSSLAEPENLKTSLLIDFCHGRFCFQLLCSACTVRNLTCAETGRTIDWIHCKAFLRTKLQGGIPIATTTMLFPCEYVTRACPGPPITIDSKKPTEDIAFFAANQAPPTNAIPSFEIHRALTTSLGRTVSEPSSGRMYNDFVGSMSKEFGVAISEIQAVHNFDLGPEFEVALCKTLRRILPQKFGICRGFVVNARGDKQGDDIVIFDRMRFPTIRGIETDDFSRKEQIPIEAVYAYIEAKHALNIEGDDNSSLARAIRQVSQVKLLCIQRREVGLAEIAPYVAVNQDTFEPLSGWPDCRNPIYGAVVSRQVRLKQGGPILIDSDSIKAALSDLVVKCEIPPDLIVAGANNLLIPALPTEQSGESHTPSPFLLNNRPESHMNPVTVDGIAFGAGLAFLLWALDWIQLGDMPWPQILRNAMPPESRSGNKPDTK